MNEELTQTPVANTVDAQETEQKSLAKTEEVRSEQSILPIAEDNPAVDYKNVPGQDYVA